MDSRHPCLRDGIIGRTGMGFGQGPNSCSVHELCSHHPLALKHKLYTAVLPCCLLFVVLSCGRVGNVGVVLSFLCWGSLGGDVFWGWLGANDLKRSAQCMHSASVTPGFRCWHTAFSHHMLIGPHCSVAGLQVQVVGSNGCLQETDPPPPATTKVLTIVGWHLGAEGARFFFWSNAGCTFFFSLSVSIPNMVRILRRIQK